VGPAPFPAPRKVPRQVREGAGGMCVWLGLGLLSRRMGEWWLAAGAANCAQPSPARLSASRLLLTMAFPPCPAHPAVRRLRLSTTCRTRSRWAQKKECRLWKQRQPREGRQPAAHTACIGAWAVCTRQQLDLAALYCLVLLGLSAPTCRWPSCT
jgi:hypothetical protein